MLSALGLLLAILDYFDFGRRFNQACTAFCRRVLDEALLLATLGYFKPTRAQTGFFRRMQLAVAGTTFCTGFAASLVRLSDTLSRSASSMSYWEITQTFLHDLLVTGIWVIVMLVMFVMMAAIALGLAEMLGNFPTFSPAGKALCVLLTPLWGLYLFMSLFYALGFAIVFGTLFGIGYLLSLPPKGFLATTGIAIAIISLL